MNCGRMTVPEQVLRCISSREAVIGGISEEDGREEDEIGKGGGEDGLLSSDDFLKVAGGFDARSHMDEESEATLRGAQNLWGTAGDESYDDMVRSCMQVKEMD